jgi:hypothetical protein
MFRSNFTIVRVSEDGRKLELTGTSEDVQEIDEIRLAYGMAPDSLVAPAGADLLPTAAQREHTIAGPLTEPWSTTIELEERLGPSDAIVIAASALRRRTGKDGEEELDLDVWLGYMSTRLGTDAPKPG